MSSADKRASRLVLPYGGERIVCELRRSDRRTRRSIAIHVEPDGRVLVDAPANAPDAEIRQAVTRRLAWIHQRLTEIRQRRAMLSPRDYVSGETVFYLGRRYRLKVVIDRSAGKARLRGGYLEVYVPSRDREVVRRSVEAWYRARAKEVLIERLRTAGAHLRWIRQPPPLTIRSMRVQWGSCSPRGRVTLNPALIRAPRECIDYVVMHELCHLKVHNHGPQFYRLLALHLPDWRRIKDRLDGMAEAILAS